MIYIGVDPGASGGIAWFDAAGLEAVPFGETEQDVFNQIVDVLQQPFIDEEHREDKFFAVIEAVGAFPGQGVASSFAFGRSYGFLRGCLHALEIPFEAVSPSKWQRALAIPKAEKKDKKKVTKARAQELFPQIRWTHRTADAGLLAEYCRITRARTLEPAGGKGEAT